MAHDAVISYSSRDKLQADAICNRLESRGIRCWIAPRDVGLGEYAESIVNAIEEARVMVLVFSANADQSPQVRREVERAVSKGTTIVPVRIEDAEMSKALELYVSSMHWLDAITPPLEQHLDKLADDLSALLAGKRETASPPPQEPAEREPAPVPTASPPPQRPADKEPAPVVTAAPQAAAPKTAAGLPAGLRNKLLIGAAALVVLLALFWFMSGSEDGDPDISLEQESAEVEPPEVTMTPESTGGEQPEVTMTFVNNAAVPVEIYWVDYDGQEQLYATVDPEGRSIQSTYEGHVWVVTTAGGDGEEIQTCEAESPESTCLIELVTGWTVAAAEFGTAQGEYLGTYRQTGPDTWQEEGPDGAVRFQFEEQDRDDWSVYLYDGSRDVDIQIDLWTGKIMYADSGNPLREQYEVLAESD